MTTAQQVLGKARSQLGVVENPPNSNRTKYGAAYGLDGNSWCNMFTWWCFREAGGSALTPKSAYTPATYQWYSTKGMAGRKPRPGALVFYDFPNDGLDRISHVGFVEAVLAGGRIQTIEGNTTSGAGGPEGVYRRVRTTSDVVGYGYPAYEGLPKGAATAPPPALTTLRQGAKGSLVGFLQAKLNTFGSKLVVDKDFGPTTDQAVRAFQGSKHLAVDGVVGPETWAALG